MSSEKKQMNLIVNENFLEKATKVLCKVFQHALLIFSRCMYACTTRYFYVTTFNHGTRAHPKRDAAVTLQVRTSPSLCDNDFDFT